ncbi:hypothetical protein niasHS_000968 [Heterodera schachtii]|uniref:separase n=1 Tax=Heterodera schachtii TaxID=97005 RepID=A0ABD2K8D5_HETSC
MSSSSSASPISKTAEFNKCRRMISIYIMSLSKMQDEMFAECGSTESARQFFDEEFYNISSLEPHQKLCNLFAKCHTKAATSDVEEMITAWRDTVLIHHPLSDQSVADCVKLMKYIVGICFLEARFYEALFCLSELVVFTKGTDFCAWLFAILWTIRLEEWTILDRILSAERSARRAAQSDGYCLVMDCARLVQRLNHGANLPSATPAQQQQPHQCAAEEAVALLRARCSDSAKCTYLNMQARALLRALMASASRVAKADLQQLDDPVINREQELSCLRGILNSRHPEYFQSKMSSSIKQRVKDAEEFLRLCSSFAEYQEAAHSYTWELLEVGLIREAESTSITFWRDNLAFGLPFWTLRPLVLLFHIKALTGVESLEGYAKCLCALITPPTSSRNRYLHTPRKPIRQSSYRRGSVVDDSFERRLLTSTMDEGGSLDALLALEMSSVNLHPNDEEERNRQFHLEEHLDGCSCAFCAATVSNWMFDQQMCWLTLQFVRYLPDNFAQFRLQMRKIREEKAIPLRDRVVNTVFMAKEFGEEFYIRNAVDPPPKRKRGRPPKRLDALKEDSNSSEKENAVDETESNIFGIVKSQFAIHHSDSLFVRAYARLLMTRWTELGSIDECKSHIREPFECCKHSLLTLRAHWLLFKHFARKCSANSAQMDLLKSAYEDQKNFGHLLFIEWRRRNCFFLSRCFGAQQLSQWHRALYLMEAGTPALRQLARMSDRRKQLKRQQQQQQKMMGPTTSTEEQAMVEAETSSQRTDTFIFDNSAQLQTRIGRMPENLTLINLSLDEEDNTLTMSRCNAAHEPIVTPICRLKKSDPVLEQMRELLMASDESVRTAGIDSAQFWTVRKQLDAKMKKFVEHFQFVWLSSFAPLFLPLPVNAETINSTELKRLERTLTSEHGMAKALALTLSRLLPFIETMDEWLGFGKLLYRIDKQQIDLDSPDELHTTRAVPNKFLQFISNFWTNYRSKIVGKSPKVPTMKEYTMLVIPPSLSHLPWECLPIYCRAPFVYRIPCFHLFEHLMEQTKNFPTSVDGRNSYYVLNPGGDLEKTQERLAAFIKRFHWRGIIGQVPSREQMRAVLNEHDLFLYMGHGSGGRYFGRSLIRESECRAVSVLMGCSSVRVVDEGPGLDGRSSVYEYMIARAPCVIGCLWMVTDGEIDRFFMALTEYCFAELHKKEGCAVPDTFRLLLEGVLEARRRCKLPFLTGAAVVAYGLPVAAALTAALSSSPAVSGTLSSSN